MSLLSTLKQWTSWTMIFLWQWAEVQEYKLNWVSIFQAFAHITSDTLGQNKSHSQDRYQWDEEIFCFWGEKKELQTHVAVGIGKWYMKNWGY